MRVLLLDQFSDMGGAQRCLLDLLPAIRDRGWEALVGLPARGELFERVRSLGIEAVEIECGPYSSGAKSLRDAGRFAAGTPRLARQIRGMAERLSADLVYLNGPRLAPAAALANLRAPVLFHAHSYLFPGAVRRLAGISLRRARASLVGSCRFAAEPWRPYIASDQVSIIYNGVAGPERLPRPGGVRPSPVVGCIGRIAPEKGQREFLAAAAIVRRAIPQCRFRIHGAPLFADAGARRYEGEVRAAAAALPVEFAGWTADVCAALGSLDLLLVPSALHEATPRVILEAFAAGVPVIAFRSGGIPEMLDHGRTGLLADSAEEMARLAIELLRDPARMRSISRAARESWARSFTLERYRTQVLRAMERAAGDSPSPSHALAQGFGSEQARR